MAENKFHDDVETALGRLAFDTTSTGEISEQGKKDRYAVGTFLDDNRKLGMTVGDMATLGSWLVANKPAGNDWSKITEVPVADLQTATYNKLLPDGITIPDHTNIPIGRLALYVPLAQEIKNKDTAVEAAQKKAALLGYTDFSTVANEEFARKIKPFLKKDDEKKALAATKEFTEGVKKYEKDVGKYAAAYGKLKQDLRDAIEGKPEVAEVRDPTDNTKIITPHEDAVPGKADKIAAALVQAVTDRLAAVDDKDDKDKKSKANGSEKAVKRLYEDAFDGLDADKDKDAIEAVKHIIRQKVQEKKIGKDDWNRIDNKQDYGELGDMIVKSNLEKYGGITPTPDRFSGSPSSTPDSGEKFDFKKHAPELLIGAAAVTGAAVAAFTGKNEPANEQTGEPAKKKWGFARIASVVFGGALAVAALLVATRGEGNDLGQRVKTAFSFGGKSR